jgi:hypothetical protein
MSVRWKPFLIDPEIECENLRRQSWEKRKSDQVEFDTYRALLKALPEYILKSRSARCHEEAVPSNEVTLFRSRRGEWGEWMEKWTLIDGKLKKFKEGWM